VPDSMAEGGATRYHQEPDRKVGRVPHMEDLRFGSDHYVTNGALDGLFSMVAQEDKKIRQHSKGGNG
jgi:hypothetical protein